MNREALLDKGERVFVATVAFVLAMETLAAVAGSGAQFAWPRLLLSVFGGVFILYLAQRLYGGDRSVEKLALGWSGFQVGLMFLSILIGPEPGGPIASVVQSVGLPWYGLATLKLLAYTFFAAGLCMRSSSRAFLADKRGEEMVQYLPETVVETGAPVAWTAEQTQMLSSVSGLMLAAGVLLIVVGVWVVLRAVPPSLNVSTLGMVSIVEGALAIVLGATLLVPAQALAVRDGAALSNTNRVQAALQRLTWWHLAAGAVGGLFLAAVIVRFLLDWSAT